MATKEHLNQIKKSADTVYNIKDYTSATILYFKTLFAIHDIKLLEKAGKAPKDHTERFRLLKKYFPKSYTLLDMEFNTYKNTYNRSISKETCDRIKKEVEDEFRSIN